MKTNPLLPKNAPSLTYAKLITFLWCITGATVSAQDVTVFNMANTPAFTGEFFQCIGVGADGRVWAGTNGQGAYQYDGNTWTLLPGFTTHNFRDIATDVNGGIWIAQSGYTGVQSINGGVRYYPTSDWNTSTSWGGLTGLQTRAARSIDVHPATGVAYVACGVTTTGGVPDPGGFSWGDPVNGFQATQNGLLGEDMACLAVGVVGEEVWVGADRSCETNGDCFAPRIVRYDLDGDDDAYFDEPILPVDNSSGTARIRAIESDGAGRVWVGFSAGGLRVYDLAAETWTTVAEPTIPAGVAVNFNAISVGPDGRVYIGTTAGLVIYDGLGEIPFESSYSLLTTNEGLPTNSVNQIAFGPRGAVWLATAGGLAKISTAPKLFLYNQKNEESPIGLLTMTSESQPEALRICADGSSSSVIKLLCAACSLEPHGFRMKYDPNGESPEYHGSFSPPVRVGDTIITRYTHPLWVEPDAGEVFRVDSLVITDPSGPDIVYKNRVEIYRAPLLLTHGFNDPSAETFDDIEQRFTSAAGGRYPLYDTGGFGSPLVHKVDYGRWSYASFAWNSDVVPDGIDALLETALDNGYSASKPVLVGHSMGGILSRLYLQSSQRNAPRYRNDISRLITINTPHRGSQGADLALGLDDAAQALAGRYFGFNPATRIVTSYLGHRIFPLVGIIGAIRDLRVTSKPITRQLNISIAEQASRGAIVPSAVLATDGQDDPTGMAPLIRSITQIAHPDLFNSEQNDVIVAMSSQLCDVPISQGIPYQVPVLPQWHGRSPNNVRVREQLQYLIDADPRETAGAFSSQGFPAGTLEYYDPVAPNQQERSGAASIEITAPPSGTVYAQGSTIDLGFQLSGEIEWISVHALGESTDPFVTIVPAANQMTIQLPPTATGRIDVFVLATGDGGILASDSIHIFAIPTTQVDSINLSPEQLELPLGLLGITDASGYFDGATAPVSINELPDLEFQFDPAFLSPVGPGVFQAVGLGTTTLIAEYNGSIDSIEVVIVDDPAQLRAVFGHSADELCAGEAVNFTDQSLGLVTGLEWTFEGGSPATSTETTPNVTYDTPGEYAVTLTTTFQNGQSTSALDSLVFVAALPDTMVSASGGTLIATPGEYQYQWFDCHTGQNVPGATDQEFTPEGNGVFAVRVSNDGCARNSGCHSVLSTGIEHALREDDVHLRPNPNNGSFLVEIDSPAKEIFLEVIDISGRVVLSGKYSNMQIIPVHIDCSAGVYSVRLKIDEVERVLRLAKW